MFEFTALLRDNVMIAKIDSRPAPQSPMSTHFLNSQLQQIEQRLQAALQELFPPLSDLARAHVRDAQPFVRAAIVLAAATALESDQNVDGQQPVRPLIDQAMILGSALEMLSVALGIHRLLLLPSNSAESATESADDSLDKALVGSTILAGDYCFSRAASMAAETESPSVVDLFSQALQQVSEASLRTLMDDATRPQAEPHLEDQILSSAGVKAICALANVDEAQSAEILALSTAIANRDLDAASQQLASLSLASAPWQVLLAWCREQYSA